MSESAKQQPKLFNAEFSPWIDCPGKVYVKESPDDWKAPHVWNREAGFSPCCNYAVMHGACSKCWTPCPRLRVRCDPSVEVFEEKGPVYAGIGLPIMRRYGSTELIVTTLELRYDLFKLIDAAPNLDWLITTTKPENVRRMLPRRCNCNAAIDETHSASCIVRTGDLSNQFRHNLWLGVHISNQDEANERIPELLKLRDLAAVLFVDATLAGAVDVSRYMRPTHWYWDAKFETPEAALAAGAYAERKPQALASAGSAYLDWIIAGGESGPDARPSHPDWFRSLRDECQAASVPFWFRGWGEWLPCSHDTGMQRTPRDAEVSRGLEEFGSGGFRRVGSHASGRLLDGRQWNELPQPQTEANEA